jgi:hypothetical protein
VRSARRISIIGQLAAAQFVVEHFAKSCALEWRNQPEDIREK